MTASIAKPTKVVPLVLSGGAGTRLWPVSRENMPKQFLPFTSDHSLLQDTLKRCSGVPFADRPIIVALEEQADSIAAQAAELGLEADVVLEPARRDSCAAVLSGACQALNSDPDAMVLILAADHHISDPAAFRTAVTEALAAAEQGNIVTFGIRPTFAATGYGYILPGEKVAGTTCSKVARFREKPSKELAENYIAEGCLWNSGNFLARADVLASHARQHVPQIWEAVSKAYANAVRTGPVIRPNKAAYEASQKISFDFAIMEKTNDAAVKPVDYDWSDIGTWDSVAKVIDHDTSGNAVRGSAAVIGGKDNMVFSTGPLTVIQDLDDIIVIATRDAVLVTRKGNSEKVKLLADELPKRGISLQDLTSKETAGGGRK
jgi:mannose-1-phosphate guanylyltransferase / mannose-6-phosphate isomerase